MVSRESIDKQLEKIGFKRHGWGLGELNELHNIILPDEEIYECVNGMYEGGFALAVATDVRVLLIDKKPLNFLIVEDLRFDQINEIDYHHRLLGAHINISTGIKTLKFRSYNQQRLRKLITHVQHCMAEGKKKQDSHQQGQNLHLEQINQQLQAYLAAMHQHQEQLHRHLGVGQQGSSGVNAAGGALPAGAEPLKPSPELADYLFAQSLLAQYQTQTQTTQIAGQDDQRQAQDDKLPPIQVPGLEQLEAARQAVKSLMPAQAQPAAPPSSSQTPASTSTTSSKNPDQPLQTATEPADQGNPALNELYDEGMREVFGKHQARTATVPVPPAVPQQSQTQAAAPQSGNAASGKSDEINPLKIAYSKLPMALRSRRKFRRERSSFKVSPSPGAEPV